MREMDKINYLKQELIESEELKSANPPFTAAQANAVVSRNRSSVYITAGAGSGKSTVLIKRVINSIIYDKKNLDRLLVVTFTEAAAQELKIKLSKSLQNEIEKTDDINLKSFLLRQKGNLSSADICTIDAFCKKLVSEYGDFSNDDGLNSDFRILDNGEIYKLSNEAATESLENYLRENQDNKSLKDLLEVFTDSYGTISITDEIIKLYERLQSYSDPDYEKKLLMEIYKEKTPYNKSFWSEFLKAEVKTCLYLNEKTKELFENEKVFYNDLDDKILTAISDDEYILRKIQNCFDNSVSDEKLADFFENLSFKRLPSVKDEKSKEIWKDIKKLLNLNRDYIKKKVQKELSSAIRHFSEDFEKQKDMVNEFFAIYDCYDKIYSRKKSLKNAMTFSDIERKTLNILSKNIHGEKFEKTVIAKNISKNYDAIFIDEYQDTNLLQDMIFRAISRDEKNLFLVGDIKQSIYGFRNAMPQVFSDKIENSADFSEKAENSTSAERIYLTDNFRSRKEILSFVNKIMEKFFTKYSGGTDYINEKLTYGNKSFDKYDVKTPKIEIILNNAKLKDLYEFQPYLENVSDLDVDSICIANRIKTILSSGEQVIGENGLRPAKASDIVILMRKISDKGKKIKKALELLGIPCSVQNKDGYFEKYEIMFTLSFLRMIENSRRDIDLTAVLMSPIFMFSGDEVARLKLEGDIFNSLQIAESENLFDDEFNNKCKSFCVERKKLINIARTFSVSEFLRFLYSYRSYLSVLSSGDGGEQKKHNLLYLLNLAESYEKSGGDGISGFVRYLTFLSERNATVDTGEISSGGVRIMTMHKSKGLQFPIVVLPYLTNAFNSENKTKVINAPTVSLNENLENIKLGLSMQVPYKYGQAYKTVGFLAGMQAKKYSSTAEELRLLYVALTRAEEKLILIGSNYSNSSAVNVFENAFSVSKYMPKSIFACSNFMTLVLSSLLDDECVLNKLRKLFTKEGDSGRESFSVNYDFDENTNGDFEIDIVRNNADSKNLIFKILEKPKITALTADKELKEKIIEKMNAVKVFDDNFVSFYFGKAAATTINSAISAFNKNYHESFKYYFKEQPSFNNKNDEIYISSAERGTSIHKFFEICDFVKAANGVADECERLFLIHKLTERDLIIYKDVYGLEKLNGFFQSKLYKTLIEAADTGEDGKPYIFKEQSFLFEAYTGDEKIYGPLKADTDENGMIHGKMDLCFIKTVEGEQRVFVVDYKTDKKKKNETDNELLLRLKEEYKYQMNIYFKAAKKIFGLNCGGVYIFSVDIGKEIFALN